ncbi:MAG: hypothetical protein KIS92_03385 [Planctomycetota bacterium]|nr:hypothetical protein [Planctomycetota bacterium]
MGWRTMVFTAKNIFADDGTVDMAELNFILGLALRDGKIDDDEKTVLRNVFEKVKEEEVSPATWQRIQEIRKEFAI